MHLKQENLTFLLTIWKLILTIYIELRVVIYLRRKRRVEIMICISDFYEYFRWKGVVFLLLHQNTVIKLILDGLREQGRWRSHLADLENLQGHRWAPGGASDYYWKRRKNLDDAEVEKCTGIEKSFKLSGIKSPNLYRNLLMSVFPHMTQALKDLKKLLFLQI